MQCVGVTCSFGMANCAIRFMAHFVRIGRKSAISLGLIKGKEGCSLAHAFPYGDQKHMGAT